MTTTIKTKTIFFSIYTLLLLAGMSSCKKFIEVTPPITNVTESSAFETDATASGVVTGIYTKLSNAGTLANGFSMLSAFTAGLASDEFSLWSGVTNQTYLESYQNILSADNSGTNNLWYEAYKYLYTCNAAIEGLEKSSGLTSTVKKQLIGEAKFLRAFFYSYLVNSFGDVPLVTSTDYRTNSLLPRAPKSKVYELIAKDLIDAKAALRDQYLDGTLLRTSQERVRPTKWAAAALLARVYLYMEKWQDAELQATEVLDNTSLFSLVSNPANVFAKNSTEAIWQIQPTDNNFNTDFARLFVIPSTGLSSTNPIYLSADLSSSFEAGDKRRYGGNWIDSLPNGSSYIFYLKKHKALAAASSGSLTEYSMVMRLAEQYLIRAEARVKQNNLTGAAADIDKIRNRAGLTATTAATQNGLLSAIYKERRAELFGEWGDRWYDLKRTGRITAVMSVYTPLKGGTWNDNQQLFAIPRAEIAKNLNLVQNPGY